MLEQKSLSLLTEMIRQLEQGFSDLPPFATEVDLDSLREVLLETATRMQNNFPYPHPLYAGQMLKPPHPIARLAYMMSLWINPNNHALDGGRASSALEKEAVAEIARMFNWETHLGHLTSGGTMANLEALWVAGQLNPGKKIVASEQAHYTHNRISGALKLDFEAVPADARGKMDMAALEHALESGTVGTVVATLGTTGVGAVDPLPEILRLRERYGFRIHLDSAYGGYFRLADNLSPETAAAFDCMDQADSIVVDPHKHGLQPYGCGCVLFKDPAIGTLYRHDSPYTYFSSDELHLGEISLECSRAGAGAVALWATQKLLPLTKSGAFAADLGRCRQAALALFARLQADPRFLTAFPPELDIIIWAPAGQNAGEISARSKRHFAEAAQASLHLALVELPAGMLRPYWPGVNFDRPTVTCLMKPEHLNWVDQIWQILSSLE